MDEYFDIQAQNPLGGEVTELYRQHVLQDSARVFKESEGSVEVFSWLKDATGKPRPAWSVHPADSDCGADFDLCESIDSAASLQSCVQVGLVVLILFRA